LTINRPAKKHLILGPFVENLLDATIDPDASMPDLENSTNLNKTKAQVKTNINSINHRFELINSFFSEVHVCCFLFQETKAKGPRQESLGLMEDTMDDLNLNIHVPQKQQVNCCLQLLFRFNDLIHTILY